MNTHRLASSNYSPHSGDSGSFSELRCCWFPCVKINSFGAMGDDENMANWPMTSLQNLKIQIGKLDELNDRQSSA